jgi:hypothetical protein
MNPLHEALESNNFDTFQVRGTGIEQHPESNTFHHEGTKL